MTTESATPTYGYAQDKAALIKRLHRIEGQVRGIEKMLEDDRYCLWICDGFYLDMVDQTAFINHSCDPSAEIEADLDEQGGAWARVVASKPIRAGEEISYDYAFPQELAETCTCGSPKCRGYIVDPDELDTLTARLASEPLRLVATASSRARQTSA